MKEIIQEVTEEIENKKAEAKKRDIKAFVRGKVTRRKALESNIKNYQDEIEAINASLEKIEEENYEEVHFYAPDECKYAMSSCSTSRLNSTSGVIPSNWSNNTITLG